MDEELTGGHTANLVDIEVATGGALQIHRHQAHAQPEQNRSSATSDDEAVELWLKRYATRSPHTYDSYQRAARRFAHWLKATKGIGFRQVNGDIMDEFVIFLTNLKEFYQQGGYAEDVVADWADIQNGGSVRDPSLPKHSLQNPPPLFAKKKRAKANGGEKDAASGPELIGPRAVAYNIAVVCSMMKYLAAMRYLPFDPCAGISKPKIRKKKANRYLHKAEWDIIIKHLKLLDASSLGYNGVVKLARGRWIFLLGYLTGLRRAEMASARMAHVVRDDGDFILKVWGKGRNKKDPLDFDEVLLTDSCVAGLREYRTAIGLNPMPTGGEDIPLIARIEGKKNEPMTVSGIRKAFQEITKAVASSLSVEHPDIAEKLQEMTLHWLRHTGGTHLILKDLPLNEAMEWFRHADMKTTMGYVHTERTRQRKNLNERTRMD